LHSQITLKAISALRFASGDEDIRSTLYDELGDDLFADFDKVADRLHKRLSDWGSEDDDEEEQEGETSKKGLSDKKRKKLLDPETWAHDGRLVEVATALRDQVGESLFEDYNVFRERVTLALKDAAIKISGPDLKLLLKTVSWRVETAPPVISKIHKPGKVEVEPMYGYYKSEVNGKVVVVEYEPDPELRDTEQIPLLEDGGIEAFIRREVLPYTPDAWVKEDATKIGYEVSFTRHFYKPQPLRTLEEISADILAIEKEAEGLLDDLLKGATA
jgi:type I restriction enzyme M protein